MDTPDESDIVKEVASLTAKRITAKVILEMKKVKLSGYFLAHHWERFCAQVQVEQTGSWETIQDRVETAVYNQVKELPWHEKHALWLQTDQGMDWSDKDPERREPQPVCNQEITEYLMKEYVQSEAGVWTSKRLRLLIDEPSCRDCDDD